MKNNIYLIIATLYLQTQILHISSVKRPHIVFILADDLGWGDVGWNNDKMSDMTRVLRRLAQHGVQLSQYYVQQVCSPSRSALMTGIFKSIFGLLMKGVI